MGKKKQEQLTRSLMERLSKAQEEWLSRHPEYVGLRFEGDYDVDHAAAKVHAQQKSDGRPLRYIPVLD